MHDWLAVRGYRGVHGRHDTAAQAGRRADDQRSAPAGGPSKAEPAPSRAYDPAADGERAPGHEESGGYVDVDEHQY